MTPALLVDTSAWNRSNATAEVADRWVAFVQSDEIALCPPVRLELLFSARSPADYLAFADDLDVLPSFPLTSLAIQRAADVQATLATQSQHRGPSPIDLYVAAIAEVHGLSVMHYDRDFDAIASVTGQPTEWVAPRGSLD